MNTEIPSGPAGTDANGTGARGLEAGGMDATGSSPYAAPAPWVGTVSGEERSWGLVAHAGALAAILASGIMGFVVPLVVLLIKGDSSPFVRRHAVQSLNFQITMLGIGVIGTVAGVLLAVFTLGLGLIVVLPAALAYVVFAFVVMVKASIAASRGEEYSYPLTLEIVR